MKPAPFNLSLSTRKQIPANEHLTMQIASQVYACRLHLRFMAYALIDHSFLNDKMKRTYKRVIEERKTRFIRQSE